MFCLAIFSPDFFIFDIIFTMSDVLFVNKPEGMTSFDICHKLRRVFNTRSIGHTGTLDPMASGVMIILLNKATKASQFLVGFDKVYEGKTKYGIQTDTLDIWGKVLKTAAIPPISNETIVQTMNKYKGKITQIPPMTSAIKVNGKKLYEYQRKGETVPIPKREVEIYDLELIDADHEGFGFRAHVSSGTYIRTLVDDLMQDLKTVGTLSYLRRIKAGTVSIEDCDDLADVLAGRYHLHDLYEVLKGYYLSYEVADAKPIMDGKKIVIENMTDDRVMITKQGQVLAIYGRHDGDVFRSLRGLF